MKIAGMKNDGAWFRANRWLRKQSTETKDIMKLDVGLLVAYRLVFKTITDIAQQSGVGDALVLGASPIESHITLLAQHMATGIPRQVWMGKLSYDVYTLVPDESQVPNQVSINKTGMGEWEAKEDAEADGYPKMNHSGDIYFPRNQKRMLCAGIIIRDRITNMRLAFRQQHDFANMASVAEGNPGGIADAHKD